MALLNVVDAVKTYPGADHRVLDGVSLDVERGESLVVLGPSGSGKSTLLRAVAGLEDLDSGTVRFEDAGSRREPRLAMVFQEPLLYPWLTVEENIALAGRFGRNVGRLGRGRVQELLDVLGLNHLRRASPASLSGGQGQRVAVGRALALDPDLVLLDEPFSALDPATREDLQQWLRGLIEQLHLTAVTVTHDIAEATAVGDRVAFFGAGHRFGREWLVDRTASSADTDALTATIRHHYRQSRGDYSI